MPDPKVSYPFPPSPERPALSYGVLEPGLQAAVDLLEREIQNESSAGELADVREEAAVAMSHAHNVRAFTMARDLLQEQMVRLKMPVGGEPDVGVCNRCGRHHDCCVCYDRQADGYRPGPGNKEG